MKKLSFFSNYSLVVHLQTKMNKQKCINYMLLIKMQEKERKKEKRF